MRKTVDMTDVTEGGGTFEIVAEGEHYARIAEIKEALTQNHDDMLNIKLVISSGESQDLWLWDNIVISDNPDSPGYKILGRSKHFLHCIGEPYDGKIEVDTGQWRGKEVKIKVFHDTFTNKYGKKSTKAKVEQYILEEDDAGATEEGPF